MLKKHKNSIFLNVFIVFFVINFISILYYFNKYYNNLADIPNTKELLNNENNQYILCKKNQYILCEKKKELTNVKLKNKYYWDNVSIGGGGYVTGVYLHPLQKDLVYIKTDIGGFYRWNADSQTWLPLTEHFTLKESNYYGGESLAVDPNDPNIVYIAAGKYLDNGKGTIFKSIDQGTTWRKLNIDLPMGGNENKRWIGERLAIDPHNSKLLFFGSRSDGLWQSVDAGRTWSKISFSGKLEPDIGITSIVFSLKPSGLVYAVAYGDGIYQSQDSGTTWDKLEGSPKEVNRLAIASDNTLYVSHSLGVTKYIHGKWFNITPPNPATPAFNALAVDYHNPNHLLVVYAQYHENFNDKRVFESQDGGVTWESKKPILNHQVPWSNNLAFASATAAIEFDPHIQGKVWLTDWYGIWQTEDINGNRAVWKNYNKGLEELVVFSLISPPSGFPLLSGVADQDGFSHSQGINVYPPQKFGGKRGPRFQDTYSLAYCESDPTKIVRVGGNRYNSTYGGATSTDGGVTWTRFASFPDNTMALRVAVSARDPKLFLVTVSESNAMRSVDGGATWSKVVGLPKGVKGPWNWTQPLAADKIAGATFYYYDHGQFFRSTDGGSFFKIVNSSLPSENWAMVKTVPGVKGEVWLSLNWNGLYYSRNGGDTFSKVTKVERAYLFAFGKPPLGSEIPSLYLYGKIAGMGEGIFRSLDNGIKWTRIDAPKQPIGNEPNFMEASRQKFGMVFIGTNGRGIYRATDTSEIGSPNN